MKKATKGFAAGAVAICVLAGVAGSPNETTEANKAESIEISVPFSRTEYDLNTEIPVTISITPDGSSSDALEYFSDSSAVSFEDSVITTGEIEGDYSFYVRAGDVESNILSIHVTDISAKNEATRKAEEERLARESEEKRAAEEQAAKENEEQKAAEEQAAREAEQAAFAEQVTANLPEPEPEPQAVEEAPQIVEVPVQEVPVSGTAYLSATGTKYHSIDHCGKMNPNKARKTTVSEAEAAGYERCSKCW